MKNIAIIVGAGSGERFGSYKQVETINNKPVYKYSIDAFLDSECFSQIILAVPKKLLRCSCSPYCWTSLYASNTKKT